MKKKSGSRIVRVITRIINVRKWVDWDRMKSFTLYLVNGVKRLFVPQEPTHVESFDEAVKKLKLNEADLIIKQKALFRLSVIMVIAAFMLLIYTGYQLFYGSWKATIISLVVVMIALVLAFRYHFWYYQIKQRKLGCTVKEWYRQGLLGEKE
ncbi:TPA: type IV secretion protein IcmV [Legionella pneumophila]|uniref:type IVB secretion system protein IcmV n=1 Tax=Legionella sp. PATHC039 TaxID=2992042 RepID=UPI00077834CF|nr:MULTISPECIES: type IVB secretion system protein IcmV [Legionella]HAT8858406.1 type IV secretion protein IcmV [Legionella pneumophila subsp. pneumophila]MCW8396701.1 type IVB secretion system protein IcmV [Legionella sp. PATHC039]HAT7073822.1 type IV secretion protein IcmV [Legionella pneumophila]HAT8642708.1 type IV secretion protein IcmV [Legionella pneumophila]HAT8869132.1 type IV secretion protein IcmV [Legionella pneumophila subsp. pneumophila]